MPDLHGSAKVPPVHTPTTMPPASLVGMGASAVPPSRIVTPPQPATAPRTEHGLLALQVVKLSNTSPSVLQPATLVPLHADWVASQASGTHAFIRQYQEAGQSFEVRHPMHTLLDVSQTMPRALQSAFEVQAGLQKLRRQCTLLALQWLSTRHSRQRPFAVSHRLLVQSPLFLQTATATHLLALQACPAEQSASLLHWMHTPRVESQMGSAPEQSLLLLQGVKVTQRLPRQCAPEAQSAVFTQGTQRFVTGSHH